jgi:hypothetical protein
MAYWHSRENIEEFTCFSCVEKSCEQPLETSVVGGKYKERTVGEKIENIFIVKEIEKNRDSGDEKNYKFSHETALIIQTENSFYVFWRHLIFDRIYVSVCKDLDGAVESVKILYEGDKEMEDVSVIKSKVVETL